jgi:hypothetical protein
VKTPPVYLALFLAACAATARADYAKALQEARVAGEKLGFTTIHQIRASFIRSRRLLSVEEAWLDVQTGAFKKIVRSDETDEADPLAGGKMPDKLPFKFGRWRTDEGSFMLTHEGANWSPMFPAPVATPGPGGAPAVQMDEREMMLMRLSRDWTRAFGEAMMQRHNVYAAAEPAYDPLPLSDVEEEQWTSQRFNGVVGEDITLWHGVVRLGRHLAMGVTSEMVENRFENANDLTPPPELLAQSKRLAPFAGKVPPLDANGLPPFMGPPRPTFGFLYAPVPDNLELRVRTVYPGSPADKAGLKWDDVIVAIGEQKVAELPDRKALFELLRTTSKAEFTIQRRDETVRLTMEKVDSSTFVKPAE